ncbi:unnamed protein product [Symbiodinium sp. KB8]|nr:unnamed protein product [Symbiodinium sp. KB8]
MVQWDFAERRWRDISKARSPFATQGWYPPADEPGLEGTTPPPPPPPPRPPVTDPKLPAKPARKPPSPAESMAKLLRACATEAGKRELLVNHGWTGYQTQKKEDQPWVVWWYFSDTIWAWDSDLFGAEEVRPCLLPPGHSSRGRRQVDVPPPLPTLYEARHPRQS